MTVGELENILENVSTDAEVVIDKGYIQCNIELVKLDQQWSKEAEVKNQVLLVVEN